MTEILIFSLILVGIPWFVISLIKNYFQQRSSKREIEKRRQAHALNPSLKHEEAIRSVERVLRMENRQNFMRRSQTYQGTTEFSTPITNKANEILKNIGDDKKLTKQEKNKLFIYLYNNLKSKILEEHDSKVAFEAEKLTKLEDQKRQMQLIAAKHLRRKLIIDRLSGNLSYVCLEEKSPLSGKVNYPFVFKSNKWEYVNGDYVLFGGASYNEGVVNLYKNLYNLKRLKKIKIINALDDPRTI